MVSPDGGADVRADPRLRHPDVDPLVLGAGNGGYLLFDSSSAWLIPCDDSDWDVDVVRRDRQAG